MSYAAKTSYNLQFPHLAEPCGPVRLIRISYVLDCKRILTTSRIPLPKLEMEAVGLAASVITIVNLTAVCLKSSSKLVGPSSYKPERLQSLYATLYGFNGTVRNLQTHLEIYEDDQSRLDTLDRLQEPLKRCREALQLLSSRLKSDGFFAQYVMGSRFDKKLDLCLRVLNDTKGLLELSLQSDQRFD